MKSIRSLPQSLPLCGAWPGRPPLPPVGRRLQADLHVELPAAGDDVLAALLGGADHQRVRLGEFLQALHQPPSLQAGVAGAGKSGGMWLVRRRASNSIGWLVSGGEGCFHPPPRFLLKGNQLNTEAMLAALLLSSFFLWRGGGCLGLLF